MGPHQPPSVPDHDRRRPRRHPRHPRAARPGPAARDLLPLLEQLRARVGQEARRDRPALHQGHRHQAQDRPHLPHGPAAGQVRLRGPDAGRPRPGRDAHALPVALRAAAGGRLRRGGRAREAVRQGHRLRYEGGARQGRVARGAPVPRHVRGRLPRGPLQEGQPQGAGHLGGSLHRRQGAEEDGEPGGDPHQRRTTTRSPPRGPCCGRSAAWRWTRTARRSRINSPATVQTIEWYKKMYRDCMEPEVLSWSDASNNESLQQGKAGWIHNPVVGLHRGQAAQAGHRRRHQPPPEPGRAPAGATRPTRRATSASGSSPRTSSLQGVDPLSARQARELRRVHHVGRRLQPARLREAPGPPGAPDRSQVSPRSRGRACSTTPTAGRRPPRTRCSSSPTPISCPT